MEKLIKFFVSTLTLLALSLSAGAEDAAAFRVGVFDQAGVQAFMQSNEGLAEEALQQALSTRLERLAARHQLPLIFLHDINDASPFIFLTQRVENIVLNEALGEESPPPGEATPFPEGPKLGTLQVQHLLDQILESEVIKAQLSQQFGAIQEVQELLEEVNFYEDMLGEIEKRKLSSQQVEIRYGLSREEIEQLAVDALMKLESAEDQFYQQVTRFYVQVLVGIAFDIAEEEEYTHIFQFRNGPSPRLVFSSGVTITDLTGKVADRLNQLDLEEAEATVE